MAKTPPAQPRGSRITQSATTVPAAHRGEIVLIVLVEMRGGRRLTLDAFGSRVWTQLAGRPTLPLLMEQLRGGDERVDQVAERVTRLLAYWRERDVIVWR